MAGRVRKQVNRLLRRRDTIADPSLTPAGTPTSTPSSATSSPGTPRIPVASSKLASPTKKTKTDAVKPKSPEVQLAEKSEVGKKIIEVKEAELRKEAIEKAQTLVIKTHKSRKQLHDVRISTLENRAAAAYDNLSKAAKHMKEGQRGYDTFTSAMIEWLQVVHLLFDALKIKSPAGILWNKLAHSAFIDQVREGRDLKNAVEEAGEATYQVDVLPKMTYKIDMGADNTLDLSSLHNKLLREDGHPLMAGIWPAEEQMARELGLSDVLEMGVVEWLNKCGCSYNSSTKKVTNDNTSDEIDADVFEAMKKDPQSGMGAFFTGCFVAPPAPTAGPRP